MSHQSSNDLIKGLMKRGIKERFGIVGLCDFLIGSATDRNREVGRKSELRDKVKKL